MGILSFLVLILLFVLFRYNNKNYRVDEIDFEQNPNTTFLNHDGRQISFKDYYKEHYNLEIKNLKQPLLVTRAKVSHCSDYVAFNIILISLLFPRRRPRRRRMSARPSP